LSWPTWIELIWDNSITHKELIGLGWPTWRKLDKADRIFECVFGLAYL
jgi:hypothetical protein